MKLLFDTIQTPIGQVVLVVENQNLCFVDFEGNEARMKQLLEKRFGRYQLEKTENPFGYSTKLEAYFSGDLSAVDDIPVSTGGTEFQQKVWLELREIRAGETCSYGAMAAKLGQPTASRAVGMTNGLNPVSIVLPCHRVIGASGTLTGYAGGLERKKWLLEHEGVKLQKPSPLKKPNQAALF
jgi:methylated-DNA-[protein]-cysteine S-methyltransferase